VAAGPRPVAAGLRPLPRSFYERPSPVVARDLLGRLLVRRLPQATLVGRIVETEAYQEDDPASHSYRGRTPRTAVMFGPPGHLYVYFTYGMHHCMNVVTGREGEGSAVLLRAVEPLEGVDRMRELRGGLAHLRLLCAGPGRLTQAFAVGSSHNGLDLADPSALFFSEGVPVPDDRVGVGPRVGISSARERPWRFVEEGSPFVSPGPRLGRRGLGQEGVGEGVGVGVSDGVGEGDGSGEGG
jgi:DNA-3-methyladenine glycosylase